MEKPKREDSMRTRSTKQMTAEDTSSYNTAQPKVSGLQASIGKPVKAEHPS